MDAICKHIGMKVRLLRLREKLKPSDLACLLGVDRHEIIRLENGQIQITARKLQDLSAVFNVSVNFFFDSFQAEMSGDTAKIVNLDGSRYRE